MTRTLVGAVHRRGESVGRRLGALVVCAALPLLAGCGNSPPAETAVGVTQRTFVTRSVSSGAPRALASTIWYPAVPGTGTRDGDLRRDAAVRPQPAPLLLFSHGSCGSPDEATYLTVALARAGFVVVAPAKPGYTEDDYPDCLTPAAGVEAFANAVPDIAFVLDAMLAEAADPSSPFAQRIDGAHIGVSGVSFGAFAALLAAQRDARVRAVLALVPANSAFLGATPIAVPAMVIGAQHDQIAGFDQAQLAYDHLSGPRILLELLDANHLSAIDSCVSPAFGDSCVATDIPQDEAHRRILGYAVPFLARLLQPGAESGDLPGETPGVVVVDDTL